MSMAVVTSMSWLRRSRPPRAAWSFSSIWAAMLGRMPATLDSARTGRASLSNVTLIAQLATAVGVEQVAPLEHILVGAAETLEPAADAHPHPGSPAPDRSRRGARR